MSTAVETRRKVLPPPPRKVQSADPDFTLAPKGEAAEPEEDMGLAPRPMPTLTDPTDPKEVEQAAKHHAEVTHWPWPHFKPAELACKCCGRVYVDPALMDHLETLRAAVGAPMIATSGYRCPRHNTRVGGAKRSQHMLGRAADIMMVNHDPSAFLKAARQVGFNGIGEYPKSNFIHVDVRSGDFASWVTPRGAKWAPRQDRFAVDSEGTEGRIEASANTATGRAVGTGAAAAAGVGGAAAREAGFEFSDIISSYSVAGGAAIVLIVGWLVFTRWSQLRVWFSDLWGRK